MLEHKHWPVSNVIGHIMQGLGLAPFLLWMLDYASVIHPEHRPGYWAIILVGAALVGFGTVLVKGKGDSISDVILGMMPKKG